MLNQSPSRGQRIDVATASLAGGARHELADALAQPFIVSRNDHQDALAAGLAVVEYAPEGKAAVEILRGLVVDRAAAMPLATAALGRASVDDTCGLWDAGL